MSCLGRDSNPRRPAQTCTCLCVHSILLSVQPSIHQGSVVPDPKADFQLFDRVVNVASNTAVPFGLKGTVTGIQGGKECRIKENGSHCVPRLF